MAISQTTTTVYDRRYELAGRSACSDYYGEVDYGYSRIVQNDTDSRAKPANLLLNPTAGTKQSTTIERRLVFDSYGRQNCGNPAVGPQWLRLSQPCDGPFPTDTLTTDVVIRWRNKVKGMRFNASSYIAEMRETAGMVENAINRTINAVRHFRKALRRPGRLRSSLRRLLSDRKDGKIELHEIPAWWLTSHFALGPMFNDLGSALTNLGQKELGDLIIRVARSAEVEWHNTEDLIPAENSGSWNCAHVLAERVYKKQIAVGYIKLLPNWSNYTAGNLLEAVWEGVPLSFVADYFTNVGDYLSALDALDGVEMYGPGTITTRTLETRNRIPLRFVRTHEDYFIHGKRVQSGRFNRRSTERTVSSLSMPDLSAIQFAPSPSVTRVANLASVLWLQLRSSRSYRRGYN